MWIKTYADGTVIGEIRDRGITWLRTPLVGIVKVQLSCLGIHGGWVQSSALSGHVEYWHSRTAVANEGCKPIDVAERIQGRRQDGAWDTITWTKQGYIHTIEPYAIGKPK